MLQRLLKYADLAGAIAVVVGLVVFFILVVIQFVVITNGAGRVAEVSARFTLDAMPGKQMAIDADLNSGQITEDQARERRSEIAREADFYGAMDGASKFVKGDAIAAVLIVLINLVGGIVVGVMQQGMPFSDAAHHFSLLTVHRLAMDPGDAVGELPGVPTVEPAFGLPAIWIADDQAAEAEALGHTVVDGESVIVTHLTETIRQQAAELLTRQETRQLLD